MAFSIYEPGIAERALRAAIEIDRILLQPESDCAAETATELIRSMGEYEPWKGMPESVAESQNSEAVSVPFSRPAIDPSTESALADIFISLKESPTGIFQRMPSLIEEFRAAADTGWRNMDRQGLLRLRDFFLGISSEVSNVRRASMVW